jgi:1-acyl-sn-glycerol-3-phosphate acyltransferase
VQYGLSRRLAGPVLRGLARPAISGSENVPATGPAILASNHLSILDSFYLPLMLDRPVTFAAKSEYFTGTRPHERLAGAYMRATGQLSVDRAGARAAQDMLEAALALLRQGALFGVYPEGTRSPDGRLYRGRTGVGWLALHSGAPVIPVAMIGTDRLLPPGRKIPRPSRIRIVIGKPLLFSEYEDQPKGARQRRAVTDAVVEAIRELSGQEYVPVYASVRKQQLAAAADRPAPRRRWVSAARRPRKSPGPRRRSDG